MVESKETTEVGLFSDVFSQETYMIMPIALLNKHRAN